MQQVIITNVRKEDNLHAICRALNTILATHLVVNNIDPEDYKIQVCGSISQVYNIHHGHVTRDETYLALINKKERYLCSAVDNTHFIANFVLIDGRAFYQYDLHLSFIGQFVLN